MSQTPVYIWDAQSFDNPSSFIPKDLSNAFEISDKLSSNNSQIAHFKSPRFLLFAQAFQDVVNAGNFPTAINENFKNIKLEIIDSAIENHFNYISIDKSNNTEGMVIEIIRQLANHFGLIAVDYFGFVFLPDGTIYPDDIAKMVKESPSYFDIKLLDFRVYNYITPNDLENQMQRLTSTGSEVRKLTIGENIIEDYRAKGWLGGNMITNGFRIISTLLPINTEVTIEDAFDGVWFYIVGAQSPSQPKKSSHKDIKFNSHHSTINLSKILKLLKFAQIALICSSIMGVLVFYYFLTHPDPHIIPFFTTLFTMFAGSEKFYTPYLINLLLVVAPSLAGLEIASRYTNLSSNLEKIYLVVILIGIPWIIIANIHLLFLMYRQQNQLT